MKRAKRVFFSLTFIFFLSAGSSSVFSFPIVLQNATETFSQGLLPVSETIDGVFFLGPGNGWGIRDSGGNTANQTAVWETASDLTAQDVNPGVG